MAEQGNMGLALALMDMVEQLVVTDPRLADRLNDGEDEGKKLVALAIMGHRATKSGDEETLLKTGIQAMQLIDGLDLERAKDVIMELAIHFAVALEEGVQK